MGIPQDKVLYQDILNHSIFKIYLLEQKDAHKAYAAFLKKHGKSIWEELQRGLPAESFIVSDEGLEPFTVEQTLLDSVMKDIIMVQRLEAARDKPDYKTSFTCFHEFKQNAPIAVNAIRQLREHLAILHDYVDFYLFNEPVLNDKGINYDTLVYVLSFLEKGLKSKAKAIVAGSSLDEGWFGNLIFPKTTEKGRRLKIVSSQAVLAFNLSYTLRRWTHPKHKTLNAKMMVQSLDRLPPYHEGGRPYYGLIARLINKTLPPSIKLTARNAKDMVERLVKQDALLWKWEYNLRFDKLLIN